MGSARYLPVAGASSSVSDRLQQGAVEAKLLQKE